MTTAKPSEAWDTAVGVARVRARETRRENPCSWTRSRRHLPPPAACRWTGSRRERPWTTRPGGAGARRRWGAVAFSIVVRTRFLDELLRDGADAGCRQVALLGAGMNSRAYRLDWPSETRLFEIETAEPLGFKESVLGPSRPIRAASGSPYRSTCARTGPVPWSLPGTIRRSPRCGSPRAC